MILNRKLSDSVPFVFVLVAVTYRYITDRVLDKLSSQISTEWVAIGTNLGLDRHRLRRIREDNPRDLLGTVRIVLHDWRESNTASEAEMLGQLEQCFSDVNRQDLVQLIQNLSVN